MNDTELFKHFARVSLGIPKVIGVILKKINEAKKKGRLEVCMSNDVFYPMKVCFDTKWVTIRLLEEMGYQTTHTNFSDGLNIFWGSRGARLKRMFGTQEDLDKKEGRQYEVTK